MQTSYAMVQTEGEETSLAKLFPIGRLLTSSDALPLSNRDHRGLGRELVKGTRKGGPRGTEEGGGGGGSATVSGAGKVPSCGIRGRWGGKWGW